MDGDDSLDYGGDDPNDDNGLDLLTGDSSAADDVSGGATSDNLAGYYTGSDGVTPTDPDGSSTILQGLSGLASSLFGSSSVASGVGASLGLTDGNGNLTSTGELVLFGGGALLLFGMLA